MVEPIPFKFNGIHGAAVAVVAATRLTIQCIVALYENHVKYYAI